MSPPPSRRPTPAYNLNSPSHQTLARPGKSRDASADLERDILRPVPAFMRAKWTSYRARNY